MIASSGSGASKLQLTPAHPGRTLPEAASHMVLSFSYTPEAGVALQPGGFPPQLAKEVETFIQKFGSVPAFTANRTMELFQMSQARE